MFYLNLIPNKLLCGKSKLSLTINDGDGLRRGGGMENGVEEMMGTILMILRLHLHGDLGFWVWTFGECGFGYGVRVQWGNGGDGRVGMEEMNGRVLS